MKSKSTYKDILKRVLELRSRASLVIYERTQLLNEVFDDTDFRADLGNADDFKAASALDRYVDDTPYGFLQLRSMLKAFPERKQWEKMTLRDIYQQTLEANRPKREVSRPAVKRATKEDLETLETRAKTAEARLKHTEQLLQDRTKSYEELLEENRELRRENRDLRAKLQAYEKQPSMAVA